MEVELTAAQWAGVIIAVLGALGVLERVSAFLASKRWRKLALTLSEVLERLAISGDPAHVAVAEEAKRSVEKSVPRQTAVKDALDAVVRIAEERVKGGGSTTERLNRKKTAGEKWADALKFIGRLLPLAGSLL